MRNVRLLIEYDGTGYYGWQRQDPLPTIQREVEEALSRILQSPITLYGSGRTDAGVHAAGQVANFHTANPLPLEKLHLALNALLPEDIAVLHVDEAQEDFHARYSAQSKTYVYTILNDRVPSALNRNFYYHFPCPLDVGTMKKASSHFLGTHDFSSFKNRKGLSRSNIRTIKSLDTFCESKYIKFYVQADGFLYQMVRTLVGTLLYVGLRKFEAEEMKEIIEARDRKKAGPTLPAKGLCLLGAHY